MKKVYIVLTSWRFGLHWFYYQYALNKETIDADLNRNLNQFIRRKPLNTYKKPTFLEFCFLMTFYTMFRNIFDPRVANRHRFYAKFLSFFAKPQIQLDISATAKIGGGLIVQHGYGTIIDPKSMGKNCWVNQGVTIGYKNNADAPYIGDNVTIYTGAVIVGAIHIGNNATIGANAVVVKDIEENCVVGGVPAKILKQNNSTKEHLCGNL